MEEVVIRAARESDLPQVAALTDRWEAEQITYGLHRDDLDFLQQYRCWVACRGEFVLGFCLGRTQIARNMNSIVPDGLPYFELEELYVDKRYRDLGLGSRLFEKMERTLRQEGTSKIMLSSATKDADAMLRFYRDRHDMKVWSMRLFKDID